MTEQEFLKLTAKAAAKHLANCPDDEALPLLLKYSEANGYAIDWMLGQVRRVKGTIPAYHDEALRRWFDAWDAGRSVTADTSVSANQYLATQSSAPSMAHSPLFGWGIALVAIGVIAIIVSFIFNVGVEAGGMGVGEDSPLLPSRVANLDLISIREMICWCGGFLFVGGLVLLSADRICGAILLSNRGHVSSSDPERAAR